MEIYRCFLLMFQSLVRKRIAPGARYAWCRKADVPSVSVPLSVLWPQRLFAVRTMLHTRTTVSCDRRAVKGGRTQGLSIRVLAVSATSLSYLVKSPFSKGYQLWRQQSPRWSSSLSLFLSLHLSYVVCCIGLTSNSSTLDHGPLYNLPLPLSTLLLQWPLCLWIWVRISECPYAFVYVSRASAYSFHVQWEGRLTTASDTYLSHPYYENTRALPENVVLPCWISIHCLTLAIIPCIFCASLQPRHI